MTGCMSVSRATRLRLAADVASVAIMIATAETLLKIETFPPSMNTAICVVNMVPMSADAGALTTGDTTVAVMTKVSKTVIVMIEALLSIVNAAIPAVDIAVAKLITLDMTVEDIAVAAMTEAAVAVGAAVVAITGVTTEAVHRNQRAAALVVPPSIAAVTLVESLHQTDPSVVEVVMQIDGEVSPPGTTVMMVLRVAKVKANKGQPTAQNCILATFRVTSRPTPSTTFLALMAAFLTFTS